MINGHEIQRAQPLYLDPQSVQIKSPNHSYMNESKPLMISPNIDITHSRMISPMLPQSVSYNGMYPNDKLGSIQSYKVLQNFDAIDIGCCEPGDYESKIEIKTLEKNSQQEVSVFHSEIFKDAIGKWCTKPKGKIVFLNVDDNPSLVMKTIEVDIRKMIGYISFAEREIGRCASKQVFRGNNLAYELKTKSRGELCVGDKRIYNVVDVGSKSSVANIMFSITGSGEKVRTHGHITFVENLHIDPADKALIIGAMITKMTTIFKPNPCCESCM